MGPNLLEQYALINEVPQLKHGSVTGSNFSTYMECLGLLRVEKLDPKPLASVEVTRLEDRVIAHRIAFLLRLSLYGK